MPDFIHYTHCPVCGSADIKDILSAKDHTVSAEKFSIAECSGCSLRFTQDAPDAAHMAPYYKSEDYISHSNTSKGLINGLYQSVRKRTLRKKRKLAERITGTNAGQLLDMGSGTGAFVNEMTRHGWQVTGLEPNADARALAKQLYRAELKDIDQFNHLPVESFDVITLWHVLEHVHELSSYVRQLKTLLKDKGRLFIAVPNYTAKEAGIYKEYWAAYDVPRHLYHFSPRSMQVLMERSGLRILEYKPMWYDSFYISMLSSKYKTGKANLVASFFNGLRSNLKAMGDVKRCSSVIYCIGK